MYVLNPDPAAEQGGEYEYNGPSLVSPGVPTWVVPVLPEVMTVFCSGMPVADGGMLYSTQLYFVVGPPASMATVDISSTKPAVPVGTFAHVNGELVSVPSPVRAWQMYRDGSIPLFVHPELDRARLLPVVGPGSTAGAATRVEAGFPALSGAEGSQLQRGAG